MNWIPETAESNIAQENVFFAQCKRPAIGAETVSVTFENAIARLARPNGKMFLSDCEPRAGRQPDQVVGIRQRTNFIKIVNTPDEPAFCIAPRTEVFDVQVAHGKHTRST